MTCAIGPLAAHTNAPIRIAATPTGAGPSTVTMTVSSATPQDTPDPVADTTTAGFDVSDDVVDLGIDTTGTVDPATEGVTWYLTPAVENHGTIPATNARFTRPSPPASRSAAPDRSRSTPPG